VPATTRTDVDDVDDLDDVDDDGTGTGTDDGDAGKSSKGTDSTSDTSDVTAEVKRRRREARELKAENATLAARLEELEGKDKSELEQANTKVVKLELQVTELQERLEEQLIKNTFLTANTHEWHNTSRAWRMLDLSDVTINDDGSVDGLEEAIAALAASDPYLIKVTKTDDDDDTEREAKNAGATGTPTDGRRRRTPSKGADEAALRVKYRI